MIGTLSALLLPVQAFGLQAEESARWKYCPNGGQYRWERDCPPTGPDPAYVYFEPNRASITERWTTTLDYLAENMRLIRAQQGPSLVYLVEAHSDPAEQEGVGFALSRRRAAAVRQYLIARGCPPDVIRVLLVGPARPAVATGAGVEEPDNRRVVIWVVSP